MVDGGVLGWLGGCDWRRWVFDFGTGFLRVDDWAGLAAVDLVGAAADSDFDGVGREPGDGVPGMACADGSAYVAMVVVRILAS